MDLTKNAYDVSATEREAFKTCRRRWYLETIENLTPKIPVSWPLEFGEGIHAALEAYYILVSTRPYGIEVNPLEGALIAWDDWYSRIVDRIETDKDLVSEAKDQLLDELEEWADLGEEMLRGYHQYTKKEDRFTVHAVEGHLTGAGESWLKKHSEEREFIAHNAINGVQLHESGRLLCPILDPKTQRPIEGTKRFPSPVLSGRIDLLVHRIDEGMRGLWIYDFKTASGTPNDRGLDFDDQVTAYCYIVWRWLGIVPRGSCLSYLLKHVPKAPRILKKGQLSTAKDQLTTAKAYRKELVAQGLMLRDGTVTSPAHAEAYEALLSRGWSAFFQRHYVTRTMEELLSFERRLFEEWQDMADCINGDMAVYPSMSRNRGPLSCQNCTVQRVCQALEDDSDIDYLIDTQFTEGPDRKALKHGKIL